MTDTDRATVDGLEALMSKTCRAPGGCPNFPECYAAKECLHEPDAYSEPKEELGAQILRRMIVRKPAPCGCVGGMVHMCRSVV